jgi:hypothetical protein
MVPEDEFFKCFLEFLDALQNIASKMIISNSLK